MWYILDIQGEVFTLSKGGQKQFQTTVMGANKMNLRNLQAVLQTACDTLDAAEVTEQLILSDLIGERISSLS